MTLAYQPLLWFAASLFVYGAAVNIPWSPAARRSLEPGLPWLRATWLLGVPIAAVALRIPAPGSMGLRPPAPLLAGSLAALCATLIAYVVLRFASPGWPPPLRRGMKRPTLDLMRAGANGWEAMQTEAHWAFARAAALSAGLPALGEGVSRASLGLGLGLAVALLALEAASRPATRAAWATGDRATAHGAALMLLSMVVFALCGSSIVAWISQWALRSAGICTASTRSTWPLDAQELPPQAVAPREIEPTIV